MGKELAQKITGGKLSWGTRLSYASGDVACNVVFGMIGTLLTLFYTDYVGISPATVGLMMLLSRPVSYTHLDVYKRQDRNLLFHGSKRSRHHHGLKRRV